MLEFLGRFHPVIVHLPIGILMLACIFILISFSKRYASIIIAVPLTLLLGSIGAIISCITGYLLSNKGDYAQDLVALHQWMGIAVSVFSLALYLIYKKSSKTVTATAAVMLILLISITGHLGGSLTHGSDYLTKPISMATKDSSSGIPPILNLQEAFVYQDAVMPLFRSRCYSCHGSEKQKGKLRLDNQAFILKGGKNGPVIVPGNADESELMKRIELPLNHDDHMAPKEKPQLTANEIKLLRWWIDQGADFKKKFKALPQDESIKPVLAMLQTGEKTHPENKTELPTGDVGAADLEIIKKLTQAGITVFPVSQKENYLSLSFINASPNKENLTLISKLAKQVVWLKLEGPSIDDRVLKSFSNFANLTKLSLSNSQVTDEGLAHLKDLQHLSSLNLVGTKISLDGLAKLENLKNLKQLYLYKTRITKNDLATIKRLLPKVNLDTGNYSVPTLAKDTTEVKAPTNQ